MDIEASIGTYYGETTPLHRVFAIEDGARIGELYVSIETGIIMNVEVDQDRRGEGIARRLYETAVATLPVVLHAPEAARTPEGDGFARAVGGDTAEHMDELAELDTDDEDRY